MADTVLLLPKPTCKELIKIYTETFINIEKALQHLTYRIFPQKGDAEITFCAGLFLGSSFKNRLEIIFYCLNLPKLQLHRDPLFEPDNTFRHPWTPFASHQDAFKNVRHH